MYNQIPYMMNYPYANMIGSTAGLNSASKLSSFLGKINFSSILTNTQKTLNVVNQAIPLYYQVKPMFSNLRTIGRIGKEFTKINNNSNNTVKNNFNDNSNNSSNSIPMPTFFA